MPAEKSDIDDIFNIPTDGSHLDDAGSPDAAGYATSKRKKAVGKFEDEVSRASEMLSGVAPRPTLSEETSVETPDVSANLLKEVAYVAYDDI